MKLRERLTLILFGLLPFHALLVTVATRLTVGPGHAPLPVVALWKEALLGIILILAISEILQRQTWRSFDRIDFLIGGFIILALLVSLLTHGDLRLIAYGLKYDALPLVAFLVLRRVAWSERFSERVSHLLITVAAVLSLYGLLTLVLPQEFFVWLGYSPLHSLYLPGSPLPAYHQLSDSGLRRVQATMSGPNQFGAWLLLPLALIFLRHFVRERDSRAFMLPLLFVSTAIFFTFSRAAWLGLVLVVIGIRLPAFQVKRSVMSAGVVFGLLLLLLMLWKPEILLRGASTRDHLVRPLQAVADIAAHPFGQGLGMAGPASNRVSDACIAFPEGTDVSWAADRTDLCVFVDDVQVQPTDRVCRCPNLPENWYLQIGIETGVLGLLLFLSLIAAVLWNLRRSVNSLAPAVFAAFLALSIGALFLHIWEDSAVALTMWTLVAIVLSSGKQNAESYKL